MWGQIAAVSVLPVLALCFAHHDNELFRLRDKIVSDLGKDTTFYSWLGLKPGASNKEIIRAYRKLSRAIHPDRNPGVEATERFARLNQVYKTLTSPLRDRYDYYLHAGFPKYNQDTDSFFYNRYRPGLFTVIIALSLVYTALQFLIMKTSAVRRRQHISSLITEAQEEAAKASNDGVISCPTSVSRGKNVFVVHPTGDVSFEGTKLSTDLVEDPKWTDTHAGKLVAYIQNRFNGIEPHKMEAVPEAVEEPEIKNESTVVTEVTKSTKENGQVLKKGAARRRPAGARGKAKIF